MSKRHALVANILTGLAIAGCTESPQTMVEVPASQAEGLHTAVRVKMDPPRARRWELGWEAAFVYDAANGHLIRRIPLTGASVSGAQYLPARPGGEPFGRSDRLEQCRTRLVADRSRELRGPALRHRAG